MVARKRPAPVRAPSPLGDLSPAEFLRSYWRRRPLLIRQAFKDLGPVPTRGALFELARRDDVEARLVSHLRARWSLSHAPIESEPRATRDWTLLVQGMNLYDAALDRLMRRFAFVPLTRLDDLMVSYATPGGGVGAHFDSYDVFLIQAHGRREWRIAEGGSRELRADLPLKILREFKAEQSWVLEPGDMLYLPPSVAHDGIAVDECVTYSVGFRAPTFQELGTQFLLDLSDELELDGRVSDRTRHPVSSSARVDDALIDAAEDAFARIRWDRAAVTSFLGRFFSEPKAHVIFEGNRALAPARLAGELVRRGLHLDRRTRLLYRGREVFINGEQHRAPRAVPAPLRRLADRRCLSAPECGRLLADPAWLELVHGWYLAGWLHMGEVDE